MFGRKKTTAQKIAAKKTNFAGVRMDRLDKAGNLPFGWVVHNKKTVKFLLSFYVLEYFYIPYRLYPRSNALTFTSRNFSGTVDFNASIHFS